MEQMFIHSNKLVIYGFNNNRRGTKLFYSGFVNLDTIDRYVNYKRNKMRNRKNAFVEVLDITYENLCRAYRIKTDSDVVSLIKQLKKCADRKSATWSISTCYTNSYQAEAIVDMIISNAPENVKRTFTIADIIE